MGNKPASPAVILRLGEFLPAPGRVLVAGSRIEDGRSDRRALYDGPAVGVDMRAGPGVDAVVNLEDPVAMANLADQYGRFSHLDCDSVLEHSRRPWLLAENCEDALGPGATLYIRAPLVWRRHAYPDDYFRFLPGGVKQLFSDRVEWLFDGVYSYGAWSDQAPVIKDETRAFFQRSEVVLWGRIRA